MSVCLNELSDHSVRKSNVIFFNLAEEDKGVNNLIPDCDSYFVFNFYIFINLIKLSICSLSRFGILQKRLHVYDL